MANVPKLTPAQIERKRVDDFYNARMAERQAAQIRQSQRGSDPYSSGFLNLIDVMTGRSPIQNLPWSKK